MSGLLNLDLGCHECARRRIDCDRHEPGCHKCCAKGIECSGLGGIRYRFNDGIASRGKLAGKREAVTLSYIKTATEKLNSFTPIRESREAAVSTPSARNRSSGMTDANLRHDSPVASASYPICYTLDHIDGSSRFFLQYCNPNTFTVSDHVAQITTVINLGFNGYRDLILPQAEAEPLIRKALILIAEQHLSLQIGMDMTRDPTAYGSLVQGLVKRSNRLPPAEDELAMTIILLLHIREIISGDEDFKLIYGSLRTIVHSILNRDLTRFHSQSGEFVRAQILRVSLFGETLFDEASGSQFVLSQRENCLEFLRYCQRLHPEHRELMAHLFEIITLACDIYVQRATNNPPLGHTAALVERFAQIIREIDAYIGILGQHLLAWSYFVLAAESSIPSHQSFFLEKLTSLYQSTGCVNIVKAVRQIQKIWEVQSTIRWTSLLGGPSQVLIM
ncbi:hypothetical protein BX600DRAFT_531024 [Xylariales sp. PMI_506]|nr:hypothetical protein BX600DRAFT_531024 [Xylariales sp. PMI_506]